MTPFSSSRVWPRRPFRTAARGGGGDRSGAPTPPQANFEDRPLEGFGEGAVLRIIRPTVGSSLRTVMSGRSWTMNAAYSSARYSETVPVEASTSLIAAQVDEVDTSTVLGVAEPFRVELLTPGGAYSTIIDRARQKDHGGWQLSELKADWDGFQTARARIQLRLGRLAAQALGAEHVCEVPSSLGSKTMRNGCAFVQTYRFVPIPLRARYVAADLLERFGTVSLGRMADALASDPANGMALVCSMMVQRLVAIDLERKIDRNSAVRPVPGLPNFMPGLFDALRAPLSRAA